MASGGSNIFILMAVWIMAAAVHAFVTLECDKTNVGRYGHQSLLTCVIKPEQSDGNVKVRVVTWKKIGSNTNLVFIHSGTIKKVQPGYKLAESSWDENNMNISLLITDTKVADEGSYSCEIITDSGEGQSTTNLKVKARYNTPNITLVPESDTPNARDDLICKSEGGYPKGQLRWYDENKNEWTASAKFEAKQMDSGLFQLTSKLPLLPGSTFSEYTCVLFNSSGIKEDETSLEMLSKYDGLERPEDPSSTTKVVAPVVVIGSLIVGLLLLMLLVHRRRSQNARRPSSTPLMGQWRGVWRGPADTEDVEDGDAQEVKINLNKSRN